MQPVNTMLYRSISIISAIALPCMIAGCTSYSEVREIHPVYHPAIGITGPLAAIQNKIASAEKIRQRQPLDALGGYMAAAQTALRQLQKTPRDEHAKNDYNYAVARVMSTIREAKLDPWSRPLQVPSADGEFVLTHKFDPRPNYNPALYDFTPADHFDLHGTYVTQRTVKDGLGAPVVAVGKEENKLAAANFSLPRIYYGVTVIANFKGNHCELEFVDPLAKETVTLNGQSYPLAADFTVPLAVMLAATESRRFEIMRVFRPSNYEHTAQIKILQPYDPAKTVVLVVHGLMDSPATWTPMINYLRGHPEIRKNYQFWFYSYPSGYPYPYSASILREKLDAIEKRYPINKPMVVVGHSMGGCISRLLITDSGDTLWKKNFGKSPDQMKLSPDNKKLLESALIFRHRPEVGRVIFIAAPLKGSNLANDWFGRLASKLVKAPTTLLKAGNDVMGLVKFQPGDLQVKTIPNSVDTMSPNNKFVKCINTIPVTPGIPHHTIMGNRGKDGPPDCSDGVVPYCSLSDSQTQSQGIPNNREPKYSRITSWKPSNHGRSNVSALPWFCACLRAAPLPLETPAESNGRTSIR